MLQLLCHAAPTEEATFLAAYEATAAARMEAGLTQLQIWRDESTGEASQGGLTFLFGVGSRKRAEEWLRCAPLEGLIFESRFLKTF